MKLEVCGRVTDLLDKQGGANFEVVLYNENQHREVANVCSKIFATEHLGSMWAMTLEKPSDSYSISLKHKDEHLYGKPVRSKVSLDTLEEGYRASVGIRVFGEGQPSAGTMMHFSKVEVYPLLVAILESPSYKRAVVTFSIDIENL